MPGRGLAKADDVSGNGTPGKPGFGWAQDSTDRWDFVGDGVGVAGRMFPVIDVFTPGPPGVRDRVERAFERLRSTEGVLPMDIGTGEGDTVRGVGDWADGGFGSKVNRTVVKS